MKTVLILPHSISGRGDCLFKCTVTTATVEFEYVDLNGHDVIGVLHFDGVLSFRFRPEAYIGDVISGSFEKVIEVNPSQWKEELKAMALAGIDETDTARHFAVMIESNGYFEVLGESVTLGLPRRGNLNIK